MTLPLQTALARRFGLSTPIIQAPMAGGSDSPELAAAVSAAGGLGFLGCAYLSGEAIVVAGQAIQQLTDRPFGLNLFSPWPRSWAVRIPQPPWPPWPPGSRNWGCQLLSAPLGRQPNRFDEQLAAVLESGAAAFSFTFGLPPAGAVASAQRKGVAVFGTATTVAEAIAVAQAGCDAVIAQGAEAGGHRGTFVGAIEDSLIGTMALVPQAVDAVGVPVIASGGIMDGRGLAAALMLGAQAVQMGTAFLTCEEAGASAAYRQARAGRPRGPGHRPHPRLFRSACARRGQPGDARDAGGGDPALPASERAHSGPLRTEAARQGRAEFLSLWAGQGLRMARTGKAADLVAQITAQAEGLVCSAGAA